MPPQIGKVPRHGIAGQSKNIVADVLALKLRKHGSREKHSLLLFLRQEPA
jgi:hypothetical protein